jgi:hypothetical protein
LGAERPVGAVRVDVHCDTGGNYEGVKFLDGGPFCQAVPEGVPAPTRCAQIGLSGASEYLREFFEGFRNDRDPWGGGAAPWCSRHYRDYQAFGGGWFGLCHVWSVLLEAGPQNHNILLGIMVSFLHFC